MKITPSIDGIQLQQEKGELWIFDEIAKIAVDLVKTSGRPAVINWGTYFDGSPTGPDGTPFFKILVRPGETVEHVIAIYNKAKEPPPVEVPKGRKKVRVLLELEYDVLVPEDWDHGMVEFHRNESSWCKNNLIAELESIFENDNGPCAFSAATFKVVE